MAYTFNPFTNNLDNTGSGGGGTLPDPVTVAHGGTGITSYTIGDILAADSSSSLVAVAAPDTGKLFISQGTGIQPIWSNNASLTGSYGLGASVDVLTISATSSGAASSRRGIIINVVGGTTNNDAIAIVSGDVLLSPLSASRPLKLSSAKRIVSTQIDLTSTNDITGALLLANGGTALTTVAAGSILAANTLDTLSAVTSGAGLKVLQNNAGTITWSTATGSVSPVYSTSPTLVTPVLGTPSSGNLVSCTGYTVANLAGLGTGVGTWLATPSSANLLAAMSTETGSGLLTFATSPTFTTDITTPLVYGSSSANGNLLLQSTSNSTRGLVQTADSFVACTTNVTASGTVQAIDTFTGGVSISSGAAIALTSTSTITMTGNGAAGGYLSFFNVGFTVKDDGTARTTTGAVVFSNHPTFTATIAGGLVLNDLAAIIPAVTTLYCAPTFSITGAGTGTIQNVAGVYSRGTVNAGWTVTNWNGMLFDSPSGAGTITNMYVIRSTLVAATNRWFLYDSGGAASAIKGNLRLGSNTAPNTVLDVTGVIRTDQTAANNTVATVLGSVGPTGANTTVQEWFKININGTTRFIPCF